MFTILKSLPHKKIHIDYVDNLRVVKSAEVVTSHNPKEKVFLNTHIAQTEGGTRCFSTDIFDKEKVQTAYNTFNVNQNTKTLNAYWLKVLDVSNQKKHGYGEIMWLSGIINLLENKLNKISIFSKKDAVMFHYKYKFSPVVEGYDEIMDLLNRISKNNNPQLVEVKQKSIDLLTANHQNILFNSEYENTTHKSINLINEFFSTVQDKHLKWKSDAISRGVSLNVDLNMKLDRETILANKEFYNELFEKHEFDYRI